MTDFPHRRFNPLRQEWVLVSPRRNERPWHGQIDPAPRRAADRYDPQCYLCPGNAREHGGRNPNYASTFAFDNDFPALVPEVPLAADWHDSGALLSRRVERGLCRVLCFSPRHDLSLGDMDGAAVRAVVDAWIEECRAAAAHPWVKYALVFENRGEMMGASSPHPHGQLWATASLPTEVAREHQGLSAYAHAHPGSCLLCDYVGEELQRRERIVCENSAFVVVVPFWALWPFETLLVSRRHVGSLADLPPSERDALADTLKRLALTYDRLFDTPFPYSMGFHQAPVHDGQSAAWHLHAHFYPPLLRSATIRKFMVGFELLGEPQRDLTPEEAADRLRATTP